MSAGKVRHYHGAMLGPEEWYGWQDGIRLCKIYRYRKIAGFIRYVERTKTVPKLR